MLRISWDGNINLAPKARPFYGTLCFPGEGPRAVLLPDRPFADLRTFRNFILAVAARRANRRSELNLFLFHFGFTSFDLFLEASSDIIDKILANWGQSLFRAGRSLGDFSEGILSVVDCRRSLRGHLQRS